ncbi:MAG TPA: sialidase family protein, partial [Thermoanaerobaculia bacterium]|nr:sialidase family protein [Thermoanaerobaculia bacterium]
MKRFASLPAALFLLLVSQSAGAQVCKDEAEDAHSLRSHARLGDRPNARGRRTSATHLPAAAARGGQNVQVNDPQAFYPDGLIGRAEPTIAADESGMRLLAAWVDFQGLCGLVIDCTPPPSPGLTGFAFSTDGGRTWTDGGSPPVLENSLTAFDPWADRGGKDKKTFYLSTNSNDLTTGAPGVNVFRGHFADKGFHWEDLHVIYPANPDDAFDRDTIVMAKDGSGMGYLSVANFIGECSQSFFGWGQIEVFRTRDGGDSWQGPVIVSPDVTFITDPADPNCGLTGINQQGAQPVIGPGGEVYVAWRFGPRQDLDSTGITAEMSASRSLDGGASFGPRVPITQKNSLFFDPPVGYSKAMIADFPRVAVADSGPHKGRVYVVFASPVAPVSDAPLFPCPDPYSGSTCQEQVLTSAQAFLSFSDDRALTWSQPL